MVLDRKQTSPSASSCISIEGDMSVIQIQLRKDLVQKSCMSLDVWPGECSRALAHGFGSGGGVTIAGDYWCYVDVYYCERHILAQKTSWTKENIRESSARTPEAGTRVLDAAV